MWRHAAAIALAVMLVAADSRASSIAIVTMPFTSAVASAARIVKGKVTGRREVKVEGATLHAVDIAIESVLKGERQSVGARVTVFDPQQWFQHTHAAALRGGVVSYADARYATPVPDAEVKPGAAVIVFLTGDPPPATFPPDSAFLLCTGAFERAQRAKEVAMIKSGRFGEPIRLAMGGTAVFPSGLWIVVKAHAHKRPMVDGPRKEMAELEVGSGSARKPMTLGHTIDPDGTQTWEKKTWQQSHEIELVGMKYDDDTTLRIRQLGATPRAP
jgi:hypothetical protein